MTHPTPETNSPNATSSQTPNETVHPETAVTDQPSHQASADTPPTSDPPQPSVDEELAKYKDLALRIQADFENFRKRTTREREETLRYANTRLLEGLLPILDNFELGMTAARSANDSSAIVAGFEMVQRQLLDLLKENGVDVIDANNVPFDHHQHEALGHEPSDAVAEGMVLRQLRKGYRLRNRLLRPANVIVSSGAPSNQPAR